MHELERYRGLGHDLKGAKLTKDIVKRSELNWQVQELPMSVTGLQKVFGKIAKVPAIGVEGFKALIRPDETHPSGIRILDVTTDGYKVFQNDEIVEQFSRFAKVGEIELEVAGASDFGRRIFAIGRMKGQFNFSGVSNRRRIDHHIERFTEAGKVKDDNTYMKILMGSGHIRGISLTFDVLAEREICINGLKITELAGRFRLPHRGEFNDQHKERIHSFIEGAQKAFGNYEEQAKIIHKTQSNQAIDTSFTVELLQPELLEPVAEKIQDSFKRELPPAELKQRVFDRIVEKPVLNEDDFSMKVKQVLYSIDNQPGAEFGKGTLWNTFNAVTYFVDHVHGRSGSSTGFEYAMFGEGAKVKQNAKNLAMEYVQRIKQHA